MRRIDDRAERQFGVTSQTLMDNAGRAVADTLLRLYPGLRDMRPLVVCGKGNNGGDGIATARHLASRGIASRVVLLSPASELSGAAAAHLELARRDGILVEEAPDEPAWSKVAPELASHRLILDAVLGTGLDGPARGLARRVIGNLVQASCPVVALDIPSGLSGSSGDIPGPAVRAEHTIALASPKIPHVFEPACHLVGNLHMVDIGIPPEAIEAEGADLNLIGEHEVACLVPAREPASHKGDYGRLLVVAGSLGKTGAAGMVCLAALRSGAGLVTAATAASAQPILAGHLMEAMTVALPETSAGAISRAATPILVELMQASDVLVVGPGLTAGEETAKLVREIVSESALPVVLDADGLNAYAGRSGELKGEERVLILTPHPGEMARLLSAASGQTRSAAQVQEDRVGLARAFAREHSCYLVLKGHLTVVAEPSGQAWINPTGNPGMATGGSGDVLTGVLAGLLGQGLSPLEACLLGVFAHGLAGDMAAADYGETSLMARDLIEYLPEAFLRLEREAD